MKAFNSQQRESYRQVCGLMLPAWHQLPDASDLSLQDGVLDKALKLRPELLDPVWCFLNKLVKPINTHQLLQMDNNFPEETKAVKLLICATYYQHEDVKKALNYSGQEALKLSRRGFGCEELVFKMMSRPKRYRDIGEVESVKQIV